MSDNIVSITNTKENVLEFDVEVDGLDTEKIQVNFVISTKDVNLSFSAKKGAGTKWSVKIPKMSILEKTSYDYTISVIADGYYFEPMTGVVNIVGSAELYTTTPKNTTLASKKEEEKEDKSKEPDKKGKKEEEKDDKDDKKDEKKVIKTETLTPWKSREKPIEQIARELMEQHKKEETNPVAPKKVEETGKSKDQRVLAILEEVGLKPKSKSKKPRVSIIRSEDID